MGVAHLRGSPSRECHDAADPLHHLPLRDHQKVLDVPCLQQVAEVDRQTDLRLLPLGHMVPPRSPKSHVPQQSSTDVARSGPPSSRRSGIETPTETTRTGSGYTCGQDRLTVRQSVGQTVRQKVSRTGRQPVCLSVFLSACLTDRQKDRQSVS